MSVRDDWQTRCAKCSATGVLASLLGVAALVLVALIARDAVFGVQGILLAAVSGTMSALFMRSRLGWPVSLIAGFLGASFAAFATLASGEVWEPGSVEWAVKGGLYGGVVGVFVGALLGLLAFKRAR